MDGRLWMYELLTDLIPEVDRPGGIHSTFGEDNPFPDERPVIVIRAGAAIPDIPGTQFQDVTVWIHDHPQSYARIDALLSTIRAGVDGEIITVAGGVQARWIGDSADLADDDRKTAVKNSTFRLAGRR